MFNAKTGLVVATAAAAILVGVAIATLILSALIAADSAWLAFDSQGIYCDRLPSLTICATLAAFAIALSFRQMNATKARLQKWFLASAIIIAGSPLSHVATPSTAWRVGSE